MNNVFKKTLSALTALTLVAGAMPANVGGFLTKSVGIVAEAAGETATLKKGVLTLRGNVVLSDVTDYASNTNVTSVVCEEGTVFPNDSSGMFNNFSSTSIIDLSNADTSNVTDMHSMFKGCSALTKLDLSNFDTSKVNDMSCMFQACIILGSLDLTSFTTDINPKTTSMFDNCKKLVTIYTSQSWSYSSSSYMFQSCSNLKGFNGTKLSSDVSGKYARIDGANNQKGYFTGAFTLALPDNMEIVQDSATNELREGRYVQNSTVKIRPSEGYTASNVKIGNNELTADADGNYIVTFNTYNNITVTADVNEIITYTHVDAVPATCTTDGNQEYYIGSDHKYYTKNGNEYTVIDENSCVISATGHIINETSPIWNWIKDGDRYDVSIKFKCTACGNIDTPETQPTLSITEADGVRKFTASVTYNGFEYTNIKDEAVKKKIKINGTEKQYKYGEKVRAVADKAPAGQYFDGWYENGVKVSGSETYYIYATRDIVLQAEYKDAEQEKSPILTMNLSNREVLENGKQKVCFTVDWELPEGYTLIGGGLVRSYTNNDPIIDDNDVTKKTSALKERRGTYVYTLTLGTTSAGKTIYSKGYIKYLDSNNNEHLIYTNLFTSLSAQ